MWAPAMRALKRCRNPELVAVRNASIIVMYTLHTGVAQMPRRCLQMIIVPHARKLSMTCYKTACAHCGTKERHGQAQNVHIVDTG